MLVRFLLDGRTVMALLGTGPSWLCNNTPLMALHILANIIYCLSNLYPNIGERAACVVSRYMPP